MPASAITSASASAVSVFVAGLRTMVFPAAIAGPSLCRGRLRGKLNGVIAAMGPIG
jgi:hypothetical protein